MGDNPPTNMPKPFLFSLFPSAPFVKCENSTSAVSVEEMPAYKSAGLQIAASLIIAVLNNSSPLCAICAGLPLCAI